jgi:sugar phosphate isomerase/epimerase
VAASAGNLGIEHLSVFGLPPVEFVALAADLGCRYLATGLAPFPFNPHGYAPFSLRDDAALRVEMRAALRDRDVSISLGEGFSVRAGADVVDAIGDVDIMAELGVARLNVITLDADVGRTIDQFGTLADLAGSRGMEVTVEFVPGLPIGDLDSAVAAVRAVGRPNFRLLVDTMHLVRSGSSAADLAAIDPALIGYLQLCDVPLVPLVSNYGEEATCERMVPGEGELPLVDIVSVIPADTIVGLEVPMRMSAEAGVGPYDRLRRCVEGARRIMAGTRGSR